MIRQSYHIDRTGSSGPAKIERDHRGTLIAEGLRVAFNRSGDVVLGTIKEYKRCDWYVPKGSPWRWCLKFEIHIEDENGHVSKIKNPNSFVII